MHNINNAPHLALVSSEGDISVPKQSFVSRALKGDGKFGSHLFHHVQFVVCYSGSRRDHAGPMLGIQGNAHVHG